MHFLLDVHLSISLSKYLDSQDGIRATHVNQILQKWNTKDDAICRYADENGMVLITKDDDFKNSHFVNKTPQKVIRLTLGNCSNAELIEPFKKYLTFLIELNNKPSYYVEINNSQITIIA